MKTDKSNQLIKDDTVYLSTDYQFADVSTLFLHFNKNVKTQRSDHIHFVRFVHSLQCTTRFPFQNSSVWFIRKILLKFRKFQPRYYIMYSYKKERVYPLLVKSN